MVRLCTLAAKIDLTGAHTFPTLLFKFEDHSANKIRNLKKMQLCSWTCNVYPTLVHFELPNLLQLNLETIFPLYIIGEYRFRAFSTEHRRRCIQVGHTFGLSCQVENMME